MELDSLSIHHLICSESSLEGMTLSLPCLTTLSLVILEVWHYYTKYNASECYLSVCVLWSGLEGEHKGGRDRGKERKERGIERGRGGCGE